MYKLNLHISFSGVVWDTLLVLWLIWLASNFYSSGDTFCNLGAPVSSLGTLEHDRAGLTIYSLNPNIMNISVHYGMATWLVITAIDHVYLYCITFRQGNLALVHSNISSITLLYNLCLANLSQFWGLVSLISLLCTVTILCLLTLLELRRRLVR